MDAIHRDKNYMNKKRRDSLAVIQKVHDKEPEIIDTQGVHREPIHIGNRTMTFLIFGHKGDKSVVKEVEFEKSIMLVEGSVELIFSDGERVIVTEDNDLLSIDSGRKYTVYSLEDDTVVALKLKK